MSVFRLLATTIVLSSLTTLASGAEPRQAPEPRTAYIEYADLDLSRSEGAAILYQRVTRAARDVCAIPASAETGARSVRYKAQSRACIDQAVSDAVASLGNQQLAAVHTDAQQKPPRKRARRRA